MSSQAAALAVALLLVTAAGSARAEETPSLRDMRVTMQGTALLFDGELDDPQGQVTTLALELRAIDTSFRGMPMTIAGKSASARVEADDLLRGSDSLRVLYFVIGLNPAGKVVLQQGAADNPVSVYVTRIFSPAQLGDTTASGENALPSLPVTEAVPPVPSPTDPAPPAAETGRPAWVPWVVVGGMVLLGAGIATTLIIID